mgnify:CR=1 FL=1
MYLLDTNICIHLLNQADPRLITQFKSRSPAEIALCSVVKAELLYGARRSGRVDANLLRLEFFFQPLSSLPFDDLCAQHYSMIRNDLERRGELIGPNDLLIAAIARAHQVTLVTNNTKEFNRVAELRVEDWLTS